MAENLAPPYVRVFAVMHHSRSVLGGDIYAITADQATAQRCVEELNEKDGHALAASMAVSIVPCPLVQVGAWWCPEYGATFQEVGDMDCGHAEHSPLWRYNPSLSDAIAEQPKIESGAEPPPKGDVQQSTGGRPGNSDTEGSPRPVGTEAPDSPSEPGDKTP